MIILDDKHLLFIEPKKSEPDVIDDITEFVEAAMEKAKPNRDLTRGWHSCKCGKAHSDNQTYTLSLGGKSYITNKLAVHYIKSHRSEVPEEELLKITQAMEHKRKMKP